MTNEWLVKHKGENVKEIRNDNLLFDLRLIILPEQLDKNLNSFPLINFAVFLARKDNKHLSNILNTIFIDIK